MEDREQSTWKKVAGKEKAREGEGGTHLHSLIEFDIE